MGVRTAEKPSRLQKALIGSMLEKSERLTGVKF
jgi:hypothetical protein